MRAIAPLFLFIVLTGCVSNVHRLNDINPEANDFPSALASEYQAYADSEAEQGRSGAASHYAYKGLKSLKGEAVEPDKPDTSLSAAKQRQLAEARNQLVRLLTEDMKRVSPQKLARAQLLFDCWQHELSKDINQEQAPCAAEFHSTVTDLQEVSDNLIFGKEARHTIVFAHKSTRLHEEGLDAIKDIANTVAGMPHYRVELETYVGRGKQQRKLSEARLGVIRQALVKAGIAERYIRFRKHGGAKTVILRGSTMPVLDAKKVTITIKTHSRSKES